MLIPATAARACSLSNSNLICTSCRLRHLKPCLGLAQCLHSDITCNFLSHLACTGNGKPKKSVALVEPVSLNQMVTEQELEMLLNALRDRDMKKDKRGSQEKKLGDSLTRQSCHPS